MVTTVDEAQHRSSSPEAGLAYLSAEEVGAILGVSSRHVRRLIERGELPALRLAGLRSPLRIASSDLAAFLQARTSRIETR
jgi:excisionase family DNA binding protein